MRVHIFSKNLDLDRVAGICFSSLLMPHVYRSCLKNVCCPNLCVGASFQLLEILEYVFVLKLGPALALSQNPIFEIASKIVTKKYHYFNSFRAVSSGEFKFKNHL